LNFEKCKCDFVRVMKSMNRQRHYLICNHSMNRCKT
jgi:hypothetical protein